MKIRSSAHLVSPTARALTLLEVLVVTVLIALIAAATMVSLGAADLAAQLMGVAGQLKDLDSRARVFAQTSGNQALIVLDEGVIQLISPQTGRADGNQIISEIDLGHIRVQVETDRPVHRLVVDRLGRTPDYVVTVTNQSVQRRWQVFGLTGQFYELEVAQ